MNKRWLPLIFPLTIPAVFSYAQPAKKELVAPRQIIRNDVEEKSRQATVEANFYEDRVFGNAAISRSFDTLFEVQLQAQNIASSSLDEMSVMLDITKSFRLLDDLTATVGTMNGIAINSPSEIASIHYGLLATRFYGLSVSTGGYYANQSMAQAPNNAGFLLNLGYPLTTDLSLSVNYASGINSVGGVTTTLGYKIGGLKPYLGVGLNSTGNETAVELWTPYMISGVGYEY